MWNFGDIGGERAFTREWNLDHRFWNGRHGYHTHKRDIHIHRHFRCHLYAAMDDLQSTMRVLFGRRHHYLYTKSIYLKCRPGPNGVCNLCDISGKSTCGRDGIMGHHCRHWRSGRESDKPDFRIQWIGRSGLHHPLDDCKCALSGIL